MIRIRSPSGRRSKPPFPIKVFLLLIAVTICVMLGIFMVNSFAVYIGTYYVFEGDKEGVARLTAYVGANFVFQGVAGCALVPLIAFIAARCR